MKTRIRKTLDGLFIPEYKTWWSLGWSTFGNPYKPAREFTTLCKAKEYLLHMNSPIRDHIVYEE